MCPQHTQVVISLQVVTIPTVLPGLQELAVAVDEKLAEMQLRAEPGAARLGALMRAAQTQRRHGQHQALRGCRRGLPARAHGHDRPRGHHEAPAVPQQPLQRVGPQAGSQAAPQLRQLQGAPRRAQQLGSGETGMGS